MRDLDQASVRVMFSYVDHPTSLVWAKPPAKAMKLKAGAPVGWVGRSSTCAYVRVKIGPKYYAVHRLVWLWHHGSFPPDQIDHINGDGLDNRIENLRLATNSQNQANTSKSKSGRSPFKGIFWRPDRCRWVAQIKHAGKTYGLGHFVKPEEAHAAYVAKARELFGDFARAA